MTKFLNKRLIFIFVGLIVLIGLGVFYFTGRTPQPTVSSTDPADGAAEVLETSRVNVVFNPNIKDAAKTGISIRPNPSFDFDSTWLVNTYKIIPKAPLQNNTQYSVAVLFNGKEIYSFSFETSAFSQADIQKNGPTQSQNDYAFGQSTKAFLEKYPWYTSLPIKTNNYIIDYDSNQQKFVITFLVPIQTGDQLNSLTTEVEAKIKAIGVTGPINYYMSMPSNSTVTPQP